MRSAPFYLTRRVARVASWSAPWIDGSEVRTLEGFKDDPTMVRLTEAFHRNHALQCGFCTSGMLVTGYDIVTRLGAVDETRLRHELAGNLCRCTGYTGIIDAL